MKFSGRFSIAQRAEEWCRENGVPVTPLNIVTALDVFGLLCDEAVEHTFAVGRTCTCIRLAPWRENEIFCSLCGGHKLSATEG